MHPRHALNRIRHGILVAALLCVLLARVAVPSGWMPMASADGGIVLAPCSGMGAMTVAMQAEPGMRMSGMVAISTHAAADSGTGGKHHPDPAGDHPCSGAGVSMALDASMSGVPPVPAVRQAAYLLPAPTAAVGRGLAAPPPPQTGPPFLV